MTISRLHKILLATGAVSVAGMVALAAHGGPAADAGQVEVPLAPALPAPVETATAVMTPASASDPAPPAEADLAPVAMLVDLGSGRVLYERNADQRFLPASVTKTMTAFVAFEMLASGELHPEQRMTVSREAWNEWHAKGSRMFLAEGSTPSVDDLLMGIMNVSANDGAVVLAEGAAGSVAGWVARMNESARRLGMKNSHLGTPNGWMDKGNTYFTARDLVKLADAMITRYPDYYKRYVGQPGMTWNGITQPNHDPTLGIVQGADGIKTGYTGEAHYNFLGSAKRGNRRLVMVLAGVERPVERTKAAKALMEWGFTAWDDKPLMASGTQLGKAAVQGGDAASVSLVAPRDFYLTLPQGGSARPAMRIVYNGPLVAPIAKGTPVAELEVRIGNGKPAILPLAAGEDVAKGGVFDRLRFGLLKLVSRSDG